MMAAISPADYNFDETVSTLKYASRAKSIKNEVTRNEDVNEKMIRELKTEIEKLRQQLVSTCVVIICNVFGVRWDWLGIDFTM